MADPAVKRYSTFSNNFAWAPHLPQYVLSHASGTQNNFLAKHATGLSIDFATSTRFYPVAVSVLSLLIFLFQTALGVCARRRKTYAKVSQTEESLDRTPDVDLAPPTEHAQLSDNVTVIFAFNMVRVASTLALLALGASRGRAPSLSPTDADTWNLETVSYAGYCLTYLYALSLSAALLVAPTAGTHVVRHFNCIMFTTWLVYVYRDLWPLATFTLNPLDRAEGTVLWVKIALLTINGVLAPLLIPRPYVPFDSKDPWTNPPPEQTASILSNLFFGWLDSTIRLAWRVKHLSLDMLPPLADYDDAQNLMKRSMNELDPFQTKTKGRHLMWGLLRIFRSDLIVMAIATVSDTILEFIGPLSIKYILSYIETGGTDAIVRPWFWIVALMVGSILDYVIGSVYIFRSSRMLVRIEAIVTQLVFEHALRMRVKGDVKDTPNQDQEAATASDTMRPAGGPSVIVQGAEATNDGGTSSVGNAKQTSTVKRVPTASPRMQKSGANTAGKINNLITSDLASLSLCREFLAILLRLPIKVTFSFLFLYSVLGWSALVGLSAIVVLVPVAKAVVTLTRTWHAAKMKKTDARVQLLTESISVIRMIKLFGWESRVAEQLYGVRGEELRLVRKRKLLSLINNNMNHVIPLVTMLVTYGVFTLVMKRDLTASVVFSTMTVFNSFSNQLQDALSFAPGLIRAKVSLDRVDDFLHKTELLDMYADDKDQAQNTVQSGLDEIGIRDASFSWNNSVGTSESLTPGRTGGRHDFVLRIDGDLFFRKGRINLIIGPTGSGKSSLLMALLGEMHYIPAGTDSVCSLPRTNGVAYVAQESWVQNETIRDNILFGAPFEEDRYYKVIEQCALKHDLERFAAGDMTEVGERGITLSGGQKARVTLARAIYSKAEILLLDDVLAALDVHTSRWIIEECLQGELVRGRTVLLVTHNVALASPLAEFVVALGIDGRINSQGSISRVLEHDRQLAAEVAQEDAEVRKAEAIADDIAPKEQAGETSGKLIVKEEIAVGHVGWHAMRFYFNGMGGNHGFAFWCTFIGGLIVYEMFKVLQTWWLGHWARQYEEMPTSEVKALFFLGSYGLILTVSVALHIAAITSYILATLRASKIIHDVLISSVLSATLRWLDRTPVSRIVARCTQDIDNIDGAVAKWLGVIIEMSLEMIAQLGVVVTISPVFLFPGIILATLGGWVGQLYMRAQLSIKRERSNAKAPVLGHFGAAFAGLTSIRAYGAQDMFKRQSYVRINQYTRASRAFFCVSRWVDIRVNALGSMYSAALAGYLVYMRAASASDTGLSLYMAVNFSRMIILWVRVFNELELTGNSLERIKQYLEIEHEPKPTLEGVPPAYWPASGNLKVEKLSARYSPDGPRVLHDLSFEVKTGERIGIVGRTGSGKSSLTLALLRCILTEGSVYFDGLPTDNINLDALRSHITVIPQMPELLSGTLRQNLDPFHQYDDAVLNDALRSAGLFSLQKDMTTGQITLDTAIAGGGTNLSVGQRQIMALARALVRQSKLLILDEATSAIDYATDAVIQKALREDLGRDVTLLTIAHRLQTVMDADRIMVLDAGRIVEFGKPSDLLTIEKGMLRALVDESMDKEVLYSMACNASGSCGTGQ